MTERACTLAATTVGAMLGAMAGYLLFTDRGRMMRRRLEFALDDFAVELDHFRGTVQKAAGVARSGWTLLNEALSEGPRMPPPRYGGDPHQTTPF